MNDSICRWGLVFVLALGAAAPMPAQPAKQVIDLNSQPSVDGPRVDGLLVPLDPAGARVVFGYRGGGVILGLGVTDGTARGTTTLANLCPDNCIQPSVSFFGRAGRRVFAHFTTDFGTQPDEVWATDGSPDGTFRLRTAAGEELEPCSPFAAELGGALYFDARTPGASCDLWRSNGTTAGTLRVEDFADGNFLRLDGPPVRLGNALFFLVAGTGAPDPSLGLWRLSASGEDTVQVRAFTQASSLALAGDRLFFVVTTAAGDQLWRSDGTAAGTRQASRFPPGTRLTSQRLQVVGDQVRFAADLSFNHQQIWQSDGTAAGTRRLAGLDRPLADFGLPLRFLPLEGALDGGQLFVAPGFGKDRALWATDGTEAGTAPLSCSRPGGCPQVRRPLFSDPLVGFGPPGEFVRAVFGVADERTGNNLELWTSDGTSAGTRRLRQLCASSCQLLGLANVQGQVWVKVASAEGEALWRTDGTPLGTVRMTPDGFRAPLSFQLTPLASGSVLFGGIAGGNSGLWKSDGTPRGTRPVAQLGDVTASSGPSGLVRFGDELLFTAFPGSAPAPGVNPLWRSRGTAASTLRLVPPEGVLGGFPLGVLGSVAVLMGPPGGPRLWRTDGTPAGTFVLPADFAGLVSSTIWRGDRMAFLSSPDDERQELWETDGSVAGTRRLVELPAEVDTAFLLKAAGDRLYFIANQDEEYRLWVSDGTAAGTRQLVPGTFLGPALEIVQLGAVTYFFVEDTLWRTDGSVAGTQPLFDVERPEFSGLPFMLTVFQGSLYFLTQSEFDEEEGFDVTLYRSDGTAAGTVQLAKQRVFSFGMSSLVPLGDRLYFAFPDADHGSELWRTDGTVAGTQRVSDIFPGPDSSFPQGLTAAGGRLFFAANDGEHGGELWQSDGTAAGTRLVQDINPGFAYSFPNLLTVVGDQLFFNANDGLTGHELWVYPLAAAGGCVAGSETLCLAGGRFAVQARWRDPAGRTGVGQARPLTADTGTFWFFDPANLEVALKLVDGQGLNGHHWVFTGALSDVLYALTVTDTQTGAARRYVNPAGNLGSLADTQAFGPQGAHLLGEIEELRVPASPLPGLARSTKGLASPCAPSSTRLCLQGGRFGVEVRWRDFQGNLGQGAALPLTGDTGAFWFFAPENLELLTKVVDGRGLNGQFWFFYGALSTVEYTLTVTDGETGRIRTYTNPAGAPISAADTAAF